MRNHCEIYPAFRKARHVRCEAGQGGRWLHVGAGCTLVVLSFFGLPAPGVAAPLSQDAFDGLVARCAPGVSPAVLRAVAAKESHFEPLALHNNTRKITKYPSSTKVAASLADQWIASGDSVDIGLMQINAPNLAPLGLTLDAALEPCGSLAAAAVVLREAYSRGASVAEQQAALLIMLSRYNTGRSLNGLVNGYVGEVVAAAAKDVPSKAQAPASAQAIELKAESWDVWAEAANARLHGASWVIDLGPSPSNAAPLSRKPARIHKP